MADVALVRSDTLMAIRKSHRFSRKALYERSGVSVATIRRIEAVPLGEATTVRYDTERALCDALEVEPTRLEYPPLFSPSLPARDEESITLLPRAIEAEQLYSPRPFIS